MEIATFVRKMPEGYWKASWQFLKGIENCWEMPKYLLSANRRGGRIAQQHLAKTWQFLFISFEARCISFI
jgi:hypothetical protein